jgi:hypothetical protein
VSEHDTHPSATRHALLRPRAGHTRIVRRT